MTVPSVSYDDYPKQSVSLDHLSLKFMKQSLFIPLSLADNRLKIAMADPLDAYVPDALKLSYGYDIEVFKGNPDDILESLDRIYGSGSQSIENIIEEAGKEINIKDGDTVENLKDMASEAPIIRLVNRLIVNAVEIRASDIHFEPFADEFKIRYRIDGALYEMAPPPKHLALPVISRIKVLSGLNIAERRKPQDGRIELRIAGRPIDLRVSTLPTQYGESVVLRVLDRSVVELDLEKLGMGTDILEQVRHLIHQPNGIFIVTGPTGSGKTTTLYSGLKEINTIEEKLLTAEDPVEYDLEGIMQVGVREAVGMTFAGALRAFLRQDPDRIMVGEIRDLETAAMAVQASLTGHLVLSTLHTNDAAGGITRLIDMGVEPFLISSTLIGVLAQRLIRRICVSCKTDYEPSDRELEALNMNRDDLGGRKFYYGKGCTTCNNTGYKGRIGIYELLPISTAVQEIINQRLPTNEIRKQALLEGMTLLRQSGVRKILDGVSTVEEVTQYT